MGDSFFYSAVYGYRPPFLRVDYPKPDLRFFVEAVGEHTARGLHHGFESSSGGDSILVGPTALLLYKQYGLEAGILFPVYQQTQFPARREVSLRRQLHVLFLAEVDVLPVHTYSSDSRSRSLLLFVLSPARRMPSTRRSS